MSSAAQHPRRAEEDRTCVLDQLLWEEEDVTFNINDFGGHEIYRVVHNFFLAKDGLTLLVFDIALYETSNFHALIGQWIETLCMRVPEAMIALVGTHIDECGREVAESKSQDVLERADKFIQEKTGERNTKEKIPIVVQKTFPDAITEKETKRRRQFGVYLVDQIFLVSSKNLEGFDQLKEKLIQVAKTKALILPQSWLAVSKFVQKAKSERTDCNCLSVQELSCEYSSIIRNSSEKVKKAGASRRENQEKVGRSKTTKDFKPKKRSFFSHTLQKLQRAFSPRQAKTAQASSKSTTENQDEPSDETEAEDIQLQMILDTLHFLRKTGEVLWFPENSFLLNIVFHNQDVVIDLLKAVFRHDMEDELQYDKAPFRTEYTHPRFINEREDLLKRGILSRKMIACLWEKFGLKNTEIDAMIELMLKFDLCYDVSVQETEEEVDSTRASHFHIPWLLRETRPGDVMLQWPASLPSDHVQLTLEYHFQNSCPIGLYEMAAVRLHRYLGPFKTTRIDWTDGVVAQVGQGFLNMERRETATGGLIMVAIRGKNVSDLWPHTVKLHDEMVEILEQECPGSRCDAYLVCPHCVAAGFQDPTLFPAEVLTSPPPMTLSVVPCLRSANGKVPAYLVYPNAQDQGIMTADHRRALRAHRVRLVEDISSPSALDILNRLYAAAIITEREMVTMRSADLKYDMVEALLDILPGKGDRAFGEFVTGLECCGYGDIARLLKYQFKF
ncbi:malignant fibrous histiocytoma-amplified sequence 1 homolog [Lingula anatina]|uniref:Malignant fibrous histiocytoma-amplified sequence 1 homolog n=1 Tax=Lingula anatina TaxID=7574 RepID=A0A1S3IVD9_LINAN|nr:malignant fibrous histiocytoma-amplified sequence 1 homolog [Lingula anatina]|eukprot:XP_013401509.1 malignant fibrous histiocytoma-amplified sequence 1 homolog [Lingula anatina]